MHKKILIVVRGGVVTSVYTDSDRPLAVEVCDLDDLEDTHPDVDKDERVMQAIKGLKEIY